MDAVRRYSDGVTHRTPNGVKLRPTGNLTITPQADITRIILRDGINKPDEPNRFDRPNTIRRADGIWVMVYREGRHHWEDQYKADATIRFLKPDGTWTEDNTYLDGSPVVYDSRTPTPDNPETGPSEFKLLLCPNGDLLLHGWDIDYNVWNNGTFQCRSTDGGKTWGPWSQINFLNAPIASTSIMMLEDTFIYDGVLYSATRYKDADTDPNEGGYFVKTVDNGITWEYISTIIHHTFGTRGVAEYSLEYIGNNRLVCFLRDKSNCYTWIVFSDDFGATWGTPRRIDNDDLILGTESCNFYRVRTFTDSHLKGRNNWWNDPFIVNNGYRNTVQCQSINSRQPGIVLSNDRLTSMTKVQFVDNAAPEDAGYGNSYYNDYTNKYGFITYYGYADRSDIREYQYEIDW